MGLLVVSGALERVLHGFAFSLPVAGVTLIVYALGAGPGVAFSAIVGLGFWQFFQEPYRSHQEVARLTAFFVASLSIVLAVEQLHRTQRRLRSEKARLARAEQDLRRSDALLRAIAETTPDLIFVKDRDSRMLLANPAMLAAIGKSEAAVIGMSDVELLGEATGRRLVENDRRIMQAGVPETLEEVLHAGGEERVFLLHERAPTATSAGRSSALIGVSIDVTERKRAEEALREADRRKTEFLGVLSHELRNPLAPIRNTLYLLDRAAPGGEQAARAKAVVAPSDGPPRPPRGRPARRDPHLAREDPAPARARSISASWCCAHRATTTGRSSRAARSRSTFASRPARSGSTRTRRASRRLSATCSRTRAKFTRRGRS